MSRFCKKCDVNNLWMTCDVCNIVCCQHIIAVTGCQTTNATCRQCFDQKCIECHAVTLPKNRHGIYLYDCNPYPLCLPCYTTRRTKLHILLESGTFHGFLSGDYMCYPHPQFVKPQQRYNLRPRK